MLPSGVREAALVSPLFLRFTSFGMGSLPWRAGGPTHKQTDTHKRETHLVILLKPFEKCCLLSLNPHCFANRVYTLNTVHLNVNIRSVGYEVIKH